MLLRRLCFGLTLLLVAMSAFAQQTGSISGRVTASDGSALPGVTVEARSNVLPQPRVTTTTATGYYELPALQPGAYTVTYTLSGMQTVTRHADVIVRQNTPADVKLGVQGVSESITVTAETTLVDKTTAEVSSGLSNQQIQSLPVGQQYKDILKLIPGVAQTADSTRGPSAGGNGQDNVYLFDGVNVTLPLYGTLAAEPSSYDIAQVSIVKAGARAVDFDRSGGFSVNTVSKSGTNRISGQASFQVQNHSMTARQTSASASQFQQDRTWAAASIGGPILADQLFFYGSFYRPEVKRNSQSNLYGPLPRYSNVRNEEFGKLTWAPLSSVLINGSYRHSTHDIKASDFGIAAAPTTGLGSRSPLKIATIEGSWVPTSRNYATFKFTDFANKVRTTPDFISTVQPSLDANAKLDVGNLDKIGLFLVPVPLANNDAFNAFAAPLIAKYGYAGASGVTGGGAVGVGQYFDNDDFFRKSGQLGYNFTFGTNVVNELHAGYQQYTDAEELARYSNGWGTITAVGGTKKTKAGTPIFYQARFYQGTLPDSPVPKLRGEFRSQNVEVNDAIRMNDWSFNVGAVVSNDTLYGQGLRNDSSTLSGYVLAPGTKYKMYNTPWRKMIQPRLGATWAYNGVDTVYASASRFTPAATSLPRAAAWDRRYTIRTRLASFDQNGNLIDTGSVSSSSGKLFQPNMDPREIKEYLVGTSRQMNNTWSTRLYGRYRKGDHFWEDTNNTARVDYSENAGPNIPRTPYIPDLNARRAQIGSGSSYVIAQLDGAFTKYYEATAESDWHGSKAFVKATYTWSHYYGNFDQDGASYSTSNDANIYIGSSFIGDGPGRQLWDNKYGTLHGDRRHVLKLYGAYVLPWNASAGAYGLYQSGQPWEIWDYEKYPNPDNDQDDVIQYAEPSGSRRSPSHYQLDLNYTQNIPVARLNLQLIGEAFNVLNRQTGYAFQSAKHSAGFMQPTSYWSPRRFQLLARVQF